MDENGNKTPMDDDLDSFFGSFDGLGDPEPQPEEPPELPAPPIPPAPPTPAGEQPAPQSPTPPTTRSSDDFFAHYKLDIGDLLASFGSEATSAAAKPAPSAPAADTSAQAESETETAPEAETTPTPAPGKSIPLTGISDTPVISYAPEAGTGFDIGDFDIPLESIGSPESGSDGGDDGDEPKKKNKSGAETVRKLVLTLAIITIVVSLGVLVKSYFVDPYMSSVKDKQASDELIDFEAMPEGTLESEMWDKIKKEYPDVTFAPDMKITYANLFAHNQDLAGWISIENFGINMPLAQGDDNSYYLKRDIYKKWTEYGVPFIDYRNNLYFLDRNTVVFGHNMRYSDKIFGMLEDYKTISGFKTAPVIHCNTIYDDYSWKVYAVFISNNKPEDDNNYVFNYTFTSLTDAKFEDYIKEIDKRTLYHTGVDINAKDQILTVSTCCYDFTDAKLVIIARLLRPGESEDVDTSLATVNPNPKYPQAWYDANEKTNPYADDPRWYA